VRDINITSRCLAFLFLLISFSANAQETNVERLKPGQLKNFGKNAMIQGDPYTAIIYYDEYCKEKPKDFKVAYRLAEAYKESRNYKKAQDWFLKVVEGDPENELAVFYYAQMLKMNGDFVKSKENFMKFKKLYKGDDSYYKKQIANELIGCEIAKNLIDTPLKLVITHLDTSINHAHVELNPIPVSEKELWYASLKANTSKFEYINDSTGQNIPVRKFYKAIKKDNHWIDAGELNAPFNVEKINTGNGSFSPDGQRFYFTRCEKNWQDKLICSIYLSELKDGQWQEPVMLDKSINHPKYSSTQPTVGTESAKNKEVVYFVSDRPGGRGKKDIWYTIYEPKKQVFREPKNAGAKVNTPADEMSPFYDNSTKTMYFSSNGWPGLGGLDVFKMTGEVNKWSPPINVGYPVNTSVDELYYVIGKNREEGFFVSNREGSVVLKHATCCDDIYSYKWSKYIHLTVEGKITDDSTHAVLPGAVVSLYMIDPKTKEEFLIKTDTADKDGKYNFLIEHGNSYNLAVNKNGYFNKKQEISTKEIEESKIIIEDLKIPKIPTGAIAMKNIYYETNKSDLPESSKASIDSTLLKIMNENPDIIVEISSHTDSQGSDVYNMTLSQKRAEGLVKYLQSKEIAKERLKAKGYGETHPVAPNQKPDGSDNPEGREKNRRTEFRIIGKIEMKVSYDE